MEIPAPALNWTSKPQQFKIETGDAWQDRDSHSSLLQARPHRGDCLLGQPAQSESDHHDMHAIVIIYHQCIRSCFFTQCPIPITITVSQVVTHNTTQLMQQSMYSSSKSVKNHETLILCRSALQRWVSNRGRMKSELWISTLAINLIISIIIVNMQLLSDHSEI